MFTDHGASASVTSFAILETHARKSLSVLAFVRGKQPITPDLHALITMSGLVTKNIGAQITGNFMRAFVVAIWV